MQRKEENIKIAWQVTKIYLIFIALLHYRETLLKKLAFQNIEKTDPANKSAGLANAHLWIDFIYHVREMRIPQELYCKMEGLTNGVRFYTVGRSHEIGVDFSIDIFKPLIAFLREMNHPETAIEDLIGYFFVCPYKLIGENIFLTLYGPGLLSWGLQIPYDGAARYIWRARNRGNAEVLIPGGFFTQALQDEADLNAIAQECFQEIEKNAHYYL
jgi:hypothetical protein